MWRPYLIALLLAAAQWLQTLPERISGRWLQKRRRRCAGALAAYQEAARLAPASAELSARDRILAGVLKRPEEAQQHFREAIRIDPISLPHGTCWECRFGSAARSNLRLRS